MNMFSLTENNFLQGRPERKFWGLAIIEKKWVIIASGKPKKEIFFSQLTGKHSVAAGAEYVPLSHFIHETAPSSFEYVPPGQPSHLACELDVG